MKPTIVTITGPSCAGKTTLETLLKGRGFAAAISTTTRPKRDGEIDGQTYYFVSDDTFRRMETSHSFVESVQFDGNRYGLTVREAQRLADLGLPIVVVCEPVGQKQIAEYARKHGWGFFVSSSRDQIR